MLKGVFLADKFIILCEFVELYALFMSQMDGIMYVSMRATDYSNESKNQLMPYGQAKSKTQGEKNPVRKYRKLSWFPVSYENIPQYFFIWVQR